MKQNKVLKIVGLALILIGVVFYFFVNYQKPITITLTNNGFTPEDIMVQKGQEIKFTTDTNEIFWPASSYHPTHGIYPVFDSKEPLEPDKSWTFTFDTPGIWEFHDHLRPQFTGKIIVTGEGGESVSDCLRTNNDNTMKAGCWEQKFATIIKEDGLEKALKEFSNTYRDDLVFRSNCHDVMHYIGEAGYLEYKDENKTVFGQETSYCGYGFYHGFIETSLRDKGSGALSEAKNYCLTLSKSESLADKPYTRENILNSCNHGVGHAVFDSIEGKYWGDSKKMTEIGIQVCENTFDNQHAITRCVSGVFNSYASAMNAEEYNLKYNYEDPTLICKLQEEIYQGYCFIEVGIHYIRKNEYSFEEVVTFLDSLREYESMVFLIEAYTDDTIRRSEAELTPKEIYNFCEAFTVKTDVFACIRGVFIGLRQSALSEEFLKNEMKNEICSYWNAKSEKNVLCLDQYLSFSSNEINKNSEDLQ